MIHYCVDSYFKSGPVEKTQTKNAKTFKIKQIYVFALTTVIHCIQESGGVMIIKSVAWWITVTIY